MKVFPCSLLSALFLCGCQSVTAQVEVDAVLSTTNSQVHQELVAAVTQLSGASKVLIGADELTKSSFLTLDRAKLKDASGLVMQGMEIEAPNVFKLVKNNGDCFLIHVKTGKRAQLKLAQCQAKK